MLTTILNLFGRSPFAPLQSHMEKVGHCVDMLPELFTALLNEDVKELEKIAEKISLFEHQADLTKNDIRNHLPKTLFLPIDRAHLLKILTLQDAIADKAEDIAVLTTLKPLKLLDPFRDPFFEFLNKNIDAFHSVHRIIKEIHELLESSFGGLEAQKVQSMVQEVAFKEHEADLIQRKLIKSVFLAEPQLNYITYDLWQRIFESVAAISNLSENLANRIRLTLELK